QRAQFNWRGSSSSIVSPRLSQASGTRIEWATSGPRGSSSVSLATLARVVLKRRKLSGKRPRSRTRPRGRVSELERDLLLVFGTFQLKLERIRLLADACAEHDQHRRFVLTELLEAHRHSVLSGERFTVLEVDVFHVLPTTSITAAGAITLLGEPALGNSTHLDELAVGIDDVQVDVGFGVIPCDRELDRTGVH